MQLDRPLEPEEPGVDRLMNPLGRRQPACRRYSEIRGGGGYQARLLPNAVRLMMRALQLTVPFRTGSYRLENHLVAQLRMLASSLGELPDLNVIVEGHTDVRGARRFNRKLALERANAVRAVLVEAGVAENRIIARAFGVEGATYPNGDRGGYPFDRKALILFDIGEDVSWDG